MSSDVAEATARTAPLEEPEPGDGVRRRRWSRRTSRVIYPLAGLALSLLAWEFATAELVPPYLLPSPRTVIATVINRADYLLWHGMFTAQETILGFLISAVVGIALSLLLFASQRANRMIFPLLVASQSMPRVAVAPLFVVWLGFGLPSKLLIAFLMAFFPVVINTSIGLHSVPREMILLAESMGAGWYRTFWKIRVPFALPNILGGLKVSVTLAVVGAVVGEFVGADRGLGYLVQIGSGSLNTALMFAAVFCLVVLGLVLYLIIELLELLLIPAARRLNTAGGRQ